MFIVPLALVLLISRFLFALPDAPGAAGLSLMIYSSAACFAAVLFVPVTAKFSQRELLALVARCAAVALAFILLVAADPQTRKLAAHVLPMAVTVFLLALAALLPLFAATRNPHVARRCVFLLLAVLWAAPVWLAPLAELPGNWAATPDLIVGLSPLSALATSLEIDYLRSQWFYQHSVLGSLRYEYLAWSTYVFMLATIIVISIITVKSGGAVHRGHAIFETHKQVETG